MIIITFGTFDLFHLGHLRIIERAVYMKGPEGRLVVGVSSDQLTLKKKGRLPVYDQDARMAIVAGIKGVDHVFLEESLEDKGVYFHEHHADLLVMGDDWAGKFDQFPVVYLPRTPDVSTTEVLEGIRSEQRERPQSEHVIVTDNDVPRDPTGREVSGSSHRSES